MSEEKLEEFFKFLLESNQRQSDYQSDALPIELKNRSISSVTITLEKYNL